MISPSSIAADASLAEPGRVPSRATSGLTADGLTWVAAFVGSRASFRIDGLIHRELLTHEMADELVRAAPTLTVWELKALANEVCR